ncbi:hypothetical protein AVEN_50400-1 [Araneus ventricosus]|uniref:Uncharacterized protein n=1 Tax=Araneus ventricosus TaxID=182803 RepID=A0A4Y2L772_ARAVE|nr:hypothetical protein AVEN_50400-1 [Araneus ventricosus]
MKNVTIRIYRVLCKLDIHVRSAPPHLQRLAPHRSNFQPVHLGGSSMEAPCIHTTGDFKPLELLCQPLLPLSLESFSLAQFRGFRFCERALPHPLLEDRISVL